MKDIAYNYILDTIETEMRTIYDSVFEILEDTADRIDVVTKVKMLTKIKLLQKFIEILSEDDTDHFFTTIDLINEKTTKLYREILEGYFESRERDTMPTFNTLWNNILLLHNIDDDSRYFLAKIKAYAIWRSLCEVYPLGEAYVAEEYHIAPDQIIEEVTVATCENSRLDMLFKILESNLQPPTSYTWEDALDPADFLLTISKPLYTNESLRRETVRWSMNGLSLSDLWLYNKTGSTLRFSSLTTGITSNWVHREIAAAMTKLYWGFTRVIPANRVAHKLSSEQEAIIRAFREIIEDPLGKIFQGIESISKTLDQRDHHQSSSLWEQLALKDGLISPNPKANGKYMKNVSNMEIFQSNLRDLIIDYLEKVKKMPYEKACQDFQYYYPISTALFENIYKPNGKPFGKDSWSTTRRFKLQDE